MPSVHIKLARRCPIGHKILILLLEKGGRSATEISEGSGVCRQTVYRRLKCLSMYDLIRIDKISGIPPRLSISLTEKGKKVAMFLRILECSESVVRVTGGDVGERFSSKSQFSNLYTKIQNMIA